MITSSFIKPLFCICFVFSLAFFSNSETVFAYDKNDLAEEQSFIINGQSASPKKIAVAKISWKEDGNNLCSGVLITNQHVLTAAHCATGKVENYTVRIANKKYLVKQIRVYPNAHYERKHYVYNNDIAVLVLRSKVKNIAPVPLLNSKTVAIGDSVNIYGYGDTEKGKFGKLLQGLSVVDDITDFFIVTFFGSYAYSNSCVGDSGGPAILSYYNGNNLVTGVVGTTSWGSSARCSFGSSTYYVNTQRPEILNFIKKIAKKVVIK